MLKVDKTVRRYRGQGDQKGVTRCECVVSELGIAEERGNREFEKKRESASTCVKHRVMNLTRDTFEKYLPINLRNELPII